MGIFERFLSLWVALAIGVGVSLGLLVPSGFEVISRLEFARVNLVVAVLIWLMIYPMMLKVDPSCLRQVGKKPKLKFQRPTDEKPRIFGQFNRKHVASFCLQLDRGD